jgi:hypothetical protein
MLGPVVRALPRTARCGSAFFALLGAFGPEARYQGIAIDIAAQRQPQKGSREQGVAQGEGNRIDHLPAALPAGELTRR